MPLWDLAKWVRKYAKRTGLSPNGTRVWEQWEIDILAQLYPNYGVLQRRLPHRSHIALERKASKLGLPARLGRSPRRPYSKRQLAVLRIIYGSLSKAGLEATCAVVGTRYVDLQRLAYKRGWHRPRRPYVLTGIGALDNLRRRCFAMCISMVEIDDWSVGKGYFARRGWVGRGLDQRLIDKAHRILDDAERRD